MHRHAARPADRLQSPVRGQAALVKCMAGFVQYAHERREKIGLVIACGHADVFRHPATEGVQGHVEPAAGEIEPLRAAQLAQLAGVRIHTVGVGANRIEVQTLLGTRSVNPSRDLDENTLRTIAARTGGHYFRALDRDGLEDIYAEIDALEPVAQETRLYRPRTELFYWPLGAAFLLSMAVVLILFGSRRRAAPLASEVRS